MLVSVVVMKTATTASQADINGTVKFSLVAERNNPRGAGYHSTVPGCFSPTMPIFNRQLTLSEKATIFAILLSLLFPHIKKNSPEVLQKCVTPEEGDAPPDVSTLQPSVPSTNCTQGFYTEEELAPHIQRPREDPSAPGAHGKPFEWRPMTVEERREELYGYNINGFNQFASDRISLHRDVGKDMRHPDCLEQRFLRCPGLPTTSVIIVFHNEAWSTLMRTVYSVLHTAPAALLKEIILVDDASTHDHLQAHLDEYVQHLKIVHVVRQREWKGLIQARLLGVQHAKGDVLTFLDSHCECFPGWLEPLLARIAEQPSAVVSPVIPTIDYNDLELMKKDPLVHVRGNFNWKLEFGWEKIPEEERKRRKNETHPFRTPTISGGLFSISKSFFEHIGAYDDQMVFWGGENLELSFRVWQCGGQLEIIPCSVVGHIFRKNPIHNYPNSHSVIARNLVRLAEVWMDDYKWIVYRRSLWTYLFFMDDSYGNVTERRDLRKRLNCKSFSWYLDNVYPEAYVPDINIDSKGQLKSFKWKCYLYADTTVSDWMPVRCDEDGGLHFEYTSHRDVRISTDLCLHVNLVLDIVSLEPCQLKGKGTKAAPEQVWIFTKTNHLRNPFSGMCLAVSDEEVYVTTCKATDLSQKWVFS